MGQSRKSAPNAVDVCNAFLSVVGTKVNFEKDPTLSSESMHGAVTKVTAFLGRGAHLRFHDLFTAKAEYREIATSVMAKLECKPEDIKETLNRNHLDALYDVLRLAK